jgi:hypothetical protein
VPIEAVFFAAAALALLAVVLLSVFRPGWIVGQAPLVIGTWAAITLLAVAGIVRVTPPFGFRLQLDASSDPLLPLHDPGNEVYKEAVLDFGSDDLYVVAMETTDGVFREEQLQALRRVSYAIKRLAGVRDAESLTETIDFRALDDMLEVGPFIGEIPSDPSVLEDLRLRAIEHPVYRETLISEDGRTAAINVSFQPMSDKEFIARDLDGEIRAILRSESNGARHFFVTGRPHIRAQAHQLMVRDLVLLVPLAVVIAAMSLAVMTGSVRGTLISLLACVSGMLWAVGAMGWLGVDLNLITLVLPPLLICVGSVYGVYSLERFELFAAELRDLRVAALRTLEYVRTPMFVAATTTMVGFYVYLMGDVQASNQLGTFATLGVGSVWAIALTVVPALLSRFGTRRGLIELHEEGRRYSTSTAVIVGRAIDRALDGLAWLNVNHSGKVLVGWALAAVISFALIPNIVIDTDFLTVFRPSHDVRRHFAEINRALVGSVPIYVAFDGNLEGTFRDPERLRELERLQHDIEALPGVDRVLSSVDLLKRAQSALDGVDPAHAELPRTREDTASVTFMIPKKRLGRFETSNHSSANLIVRSDRLGSARVRELEDRIRELIGKHGLGADLRGEVTGNVILINRSADGIAGNQISQVGAAAIAIVLLVGFALRSPRIGLLAIIPNILPVLIFFGILGTGISSLNLASGLIGSMVLGIAVDDTVHFTVAYVHARGEGMSTREAVRHCVTRTVGRALVLTSIMLVVGFCVILFSNFVTLRDFGYLTAITISICLLSDLTLTPSLLIRARA